MDKLTYEDCSDIIDVELKKRRRAWQLSAIAWMDFDDVCQIIRIHIAKKWDKWNQELALEPWLNTIITNQTINIIRNNYKNFARPCLSCDFNQGAGEIDSPGLCGYTKSGLQCSECPIYKKWTLTKKSKHDINLPVSMEYHSQEVSSKQGEEKIFDEQVLKRLHYHMIKRLTLPRHKEAYKLLIIQGLDEELAASKLGYYSSESSRKSGYRQIKLLQKKFKELARIVIQEEDIIISPM